MTEHSFSRGEPVEADEVGPPPSFEEIEVQARRSGRPAWDIQLDRNLVFFGWAGHTSEGAHGMPLGPPEQVIPRLRQLADRLERESNARGRGGTGRFMLDE